MTSLARAPKLAMLFDSAKRGDLRLYLLFIFLGIVALMGGASRADVASLVVLRPLAFVGIAVAVTLTSRQAIIALGWPFFILCASIVLVASYLIPVPFDVWASLPGRKDYGEILSALDAAPAWLSLTLSPSRTLNSLMALSIPLAALLLMAGIGRQHDEKIIVALVAIGAVSALLAVLQQLGDPRGPLYTYKLSNFGAPIGLFANRNHQGVTLAALIPALVHIALNQKAEKTAPGGKAILCGGLLMLFLLVIALGGSRAGLLCAAAAILLSLPLISRRWVRRKTTQRNSPAIRRFLIGGAALVVLLGGVVVLFGQSLAAQRLLETNLVEERRAELIPILFEMGQTFLPLGAGFGTFDLAFYKFESLSMLDRYYVNHAHNDWLQVAIEGGFVGAALLLAFVVWACRESVSLWKAKDPTKRWSRRYAAMCTIVLYGIASLLDYPLRTPLAITLFAVCCAVVVRKSRY